MVGVLGRREPALLSSLIARLLHLSGRHVGLACGSGLQLDQRILDARPNNHFDGGESLLINRAIDAAVIETSTRALLTEGLPYDRCQVAVLTDADEDASLAEFYIDSSERLFNVLRTQIAVSYTHLDVYKRQPQQCPGGRRRVQFAHAGGAFVLIGRQWGFANRTQMCIRDRS